MKLVVLSPADADPRELAVLAALFAAGLERYHVRKPDWSRAETAAWLRALPAAWRPRLVLHRHHELAAELGLGGRHWRDLPGSAGGPPAQIPDAGQRPALPSFTSRSCHDLATMRPTLGCYDSVFFGPVFPSISKPGHGPREDLDAGELTAFLSHRTPAERRTTVLALGGIKPENAPRCRDLGFDGVAVLGTIWQAADPLRAFGQLQTALHRHAA